MNRNQRRDYINQVALLLPKSEKYKHWVIIGHGAVSTSEKQQKEQVVEIIWAPYFEKTNTLKYSESRVTKNLIGGFDLYKRRSTWRYASQPQGKFFEPLISEPSLYSFSSESSKLMSLADILEAKKLNQFIDLSSDSEAISTLMQSKYIQYDAVSKGISRKIYVPCTEILRFYYGSSSGLLKAIFRADEPEKSLYNPKNTSISAYGVHTVHLRKGIYDIDAPFVARIAFDEYAKRRFSEFHSLTFIEQIDSVNKYPICLPPVRGRLNWKVQGQPLGHDLIVTRINQCGGGFPFEHLIFGRDNDNRGIRTRAPDKRIPIKRKRKKYSEEPKPEAETDSSSQSNDEKQEGTPPRLEDTLAPTIYTDPLILDSSDIPPDDVEYTEFKKIKVDKAIKLELINQSTQTFTVYEDEEVISMLSTAEPEQGENNQNIGKLNTIRSYEGFNQDPPKPSEEKASVPLFNVMPLVHQTISQDSEDNEVSLEYLFEAKHHLVKAATYIPYSCDRKKYDLSFASKVKRDDFIDGGCKDARCYRPALYYQILFKEKAFYMIEIVDLDGLAPVGISTMIFTENKSVFDDDFAYKQVVLFDEGRNQWSKNALALKEKVFARKKSHFRKDNLEQTAENIIKIFVELYSEANNISDVGSAE